MGLDDFKTDNPRSGSSKTEDTGPGKYTIHVHDDIEIEDLRIPSVIKRHTVDFIQLDGKYFATCRECDKVATSYEGMVKVDHLKFKDTAWYDKFRDHVIENCPDPENNTMLDESMLDSEYVDDKDDEDESGGLMSFKS